MLQARTSVSKDENDVMARDLPERTNGQAQLWASRQARPATTPRLPKLHLNPEFGQRRYIGHTDSPADAKYSSTNSSARFCSPGVSG